MQHANDAECKPSARIKADRNLFAMTRMKSTSKFLSLILRHAPEKIGVRLTADGWLNIDELIAAANRHGNSLTRDLIEQVVAENDKQRFAISDDGMRIRANQGHSIRDVELSLQPAIPPDMLYHGTVNKFLQAIQREGLKRMARNHVHLSADVETAKQVGCRRGTPIVLVIDAVTMTRSGFEFYLSDNGVWLVEHVPPEFLSVMEESPS